MASVSGKRPHDPVETDTEMLEELPDDKNAKVKGDGVHLIKRKYYGHVYDLSERDPNGRPKLHYTDGFETRAEAVVARAVKVAETKKKNVALMAQMAEDDPKMHGLTLRPDNPADADRNKVYYGAAAHKEPGNDIMTFHLGRFVVSGTTKFEYALSCNFGDGIEACPHMAKAAVRGGVKMFCRTHGAKCPHDMAFHACFQCNPGGASLCIGCAYKQIHPKYRKAHGGSGLCLTCREKKALEEAALVDATNGTFDATSKVAKTLSRHGAMEKQMHSALVVAGYTESFNKGAALQPGEFIPQVHISFTCSFGKDIAKGESKCAYIDFVICPKNGGVLVLLEVDEHEHNRPGYTVSCDTTRMWNVCSNHELAHLGAMRFLWVRVNPDTTFAIGNDKFTPTMLGPEKRCKMAVEFIDSLTGDEFDDPSLIHVCYLFYQMYENDTPKIVDDPTYTKELRPHVRSVWHILNHKDLPDYLYLEAPIPL